MDPQTTRSFMNVNLLYTEGNGIFEEIEWQKPEPTPNEIEVKAIMTGVCRSDIAMMNGQFGPLPIHMSGHEGLGEVISIGNNITDCEKGDIVATRGEPAYADYYNCRSNEYVVVPKADPKYILEPVACGINLIRQNIAEFQKRDGERMLIIGSGFLATVAHATMKSYGMNINCDVIGSSNKNYWKNMIVNQPNSYYDIVLDLKENSEIIFKDDILNNNSLIIMGVEKEIPRKSVGDLLWKNAKIVFPSPRHSEFHSCMIEARDMIALNQLNVDDFWTKRYNRSTQWQQAFADGNNRKPNYNRGYITWV